MTQKEKLLNRARNNPTDVNFEEFRTILKHAGWVQDHQKGGHQIWYSPEKYQISIQNRKGKAKTYQVEQFLKQKEKEEREDGK